MVEVSLTKQTAKAMVERLREFLRKGDIELKQTHAYEALAQMLGYRDWNSLSGSLQQAPGNTSPPAGADDRYAVLWPWITRYAAGELHADGTPLHKVETWQTPQKDGSTIFQVVFHTMMNDPEPFGLRVKKYPGEIDGFALLGVFLLGVSHLIEAHIKKGMEGVPEGGRDVSNNVSFATLLYYLNVKEKPLKFTIRARGGENYAERKALLTTAAIDAVADLRTKADGLLKQFRSTGRNWSELEQHGDWVAIALRDARLIERQPAYEALASSK